jgi:hypothetical protein
MPEGEDDFGDIGIVDIGAADGVVSSTLTADKAIDCVLELFGTAAFGEERDKGIGM